MLLQEFWFYHEVILPVIVVGELLFGAENSTRSLEDV